MTLDVCDALDPIVAQGDEDHKTLETFTFLLDELKRTDLGATEIADDVISLLPFKLRKMLSLT